MKKEDKFNIEIPQNTESKKESSKPKKEHIDILKDTIKTQYDELYQNQEVIITEENEKQIEDLVLATQDLIDNCMKDAYYNGNRDEKFVNLIYICHKLDLKLETYKLEIKIKELEEKSEKIVEQQTEAEERNNNLVYNLLGFLTAFSIVSAVVEAVQEIEGIINLMIFIVFTMLILVTTLIALHNFYENNNKKENKLQDNYFIWKVLAIIFVILIFASGIKYLINNKENIFFYIDDKIEMIVDEKVEKELNEN